MSEEQSWAEDTVAVGVRDETEEEVSVHREPKRRRSGRGLAAGVILAVGAIAILAASITTEGGDPESQPAVRLEVEPVVPDGGEQQRTPVEQTAHPPVRRRAGGLEVGVARRAPKPARSKTEPAEDPGAVEVEATPSYEPSPEPTWEPEPEPPPPPVAETSPAEEFGM